MVLGKQANNTVGEVSHVFTHEEAEVSTGHLFVVYYSVADLVSCP